MPQNLLTKNQIINKKGKTNFKVMKEITRIEIISVGQISGRPKICWSNWSGRIGRIGQTGQTGQIGQVYFKYNILFYNNHLTNLTSTNPLTGLIKLVKLIWSNSQTGLVKPTLVLL